MGTVHERPEYQIKQAKLPTGVRDEDGVEVVLPIKFKVPDRHLINLAMESAGRDISRGADVALLESQTQLLRLCLVSVGDKALTLAEVERNKLDRVLTPKQQALMIMALATYSEATEADQARTQATFSRFTDSEGYSCVRMTVHAGKQEPLQIMAQIPSSQTIARAREMARQFEGRGVLVLASEREMNIVRLSLREVGEVPVLFDDLRGYGVEKVLSMRQMSCVVHMFQDLSSSSPREESDFLESIVNG